MMSEQRFVHYQLGNAKHDRQHWELLKQMDALIDAIQHRKPCGDLMGVILCMLDTHFQDENEFMSSIEYPYMAAHTADHNRMVQRLSSLVEESSRSTFGSVVSIQKLEDMFLDHITYHDMQYVEWYKKKASSLSVEPSLPGQAS